MNVNANSLIGEEAAKVAATENIATAETAPAEEEKSPNATNAESETATQQNVKDDPLLKYRGADGSVNAESILADLKKTEERLEGLRGKLANQSGVTVEDMADELQAIEDKDDKEFAEKFIGILGKSGLSKEKASEFLSELGELQQKEDPKDFFRKEMEKLGKEMLGKVRMFRDTMRDAKEFSAEEIAALEQFTQTADGVKLVWKILDRAKMLDSGKFSNQRPGGAGVENLSHAERIQLYQKAYALKRTNPEESRAEIAKLDKMFAK